MAPFNYKGKFFLGDSGSLMLGSLIGVIFITHYNLEMNFVSNKISLEKIFIIFMMPGIDMSRLFIERIMNKKNPFLADNNHLHHYMFKIFNLNLTLIFYLIIVLVPILLEQFNLIKPIINIFIFIVSFLLILTFCRKKLKFIKIKKY